ncbi:MAG: beta-ketoacyl-ACP synthase [Proteobacteria bacterium]|nr:beta-ketoacyl-ACP synthase [Pseudomonadota bacterium]
MRRVVITGMAGLSPIGCDWPSVAASLKAGCSGIRYIEEWDVFDGLLTRLGGPIPGFEKPAHYTRKEVRSMGRVALMATRASELALIDAGLLDDPFLSSGEVGVAYGSSTGSPDAIADFLSMVNTHSTSGINANTYLRMMGHTTAVNLGIFFKLRGRILTTSSACTSGSHGIGYAYEAVRDGLQTAMVAGGAEELSATEAAVFDTLFATSTMNDRPHATPKPFDIDRDGLVVGEGAATFILEERDHALARGANIHAEIVGFGTNSDGSHVTQPNKDTMRIAMELAVKDRNVDPRQIGYVSAHGTATDRGDIAESHATAGLLGRVPISSLKSFTGHTLGACGALEAWVTVNMLREGWYHPTINLNNVDPACGDLDYIVDECREIDTAMVMSNNFAFGGINTSLIFQRP